MARTKPMADITLSDGKEINFDLDKITIKEYRGLFETSQDEEDYSTIAKASGLKPEEIAGLSYNDWRRLTRAFFKKASEPLEDPN